MPILLVMLMFLCFSQNQWFWCPSLDNGLVGVNTQIMVEEMLVGVNYPLAMNLQARLDM